MLDAFARRRQAMIRFSQQRSRSGKKIPFEIMPLRVCVIDSLTENCSSSLSTEIHHFHLMSPTSCDPTGNRKHRTNGDQVSTIILSRVWPSFFIFQNRYASDSISGSKNETVILSHLTSTFLNIVDNCICTRNFTVERIFPWRRMWFRNFGNVFLHLTNDII